MKKNKAISALLASASLATLAVASSNRAVAASVTTTAAVFTRAASATWLNINDSDIGVFTNDATISDGFANPQSPGSPGALAGHVRSDSIVDEIINNGTFQAIEGDALGNNYSTTAATATALLLDGVAPMVTNNGLIDAYAYAHDGVDGDDSGSRDADAEAVGVRWDDEFNDSATFINNSDVSAEAGVFVQSDDDDASGSAYAIGVDQEVGTEASINGYALTENNGSIEAEANTSLHGYSDVYGDTYAAGVIQGIYYSENATTIVNNFSDITATASGLAISDDYIASTYAVADGVLQEAGGKGTLNASANAQNTGTITAMVQNSAIAPEYIGLAVGAGFGIDQQVLAENSGSAFAENLGVIDVGVISKASASTYAGAYAEASGITQYIDIVGGDVGSTASATVLNDGDILVSAQAMSSGTFLDLGMATAEAYGIDQEIEGGETATGLIKNTGLIDVEAAASVRADVGTYAVSYADGVGIMQDIEASNGEGSFAQGKVVNKGTINVDAVAETTFDLGAFYGVASSYAGGVDQWVGDAWTAEATFKNRKDGVINVSAESDVTATLGIASSFGFGVDQYAGVAEDEDGMATALVENKGSLSVTSMASVNSTYLAMARANGIGVAQEAWGAYAAGDFVNKGDIAVYAEANAMAEVGGLPSYLEPGDGLSMAFAQTTYVGGVAQSAYAPTNALGSVAAVTGNNSGNIMVSSAANATAETYAASVASGFGVGQEADGVTATALFENTGAINVGVEAESRANRISIAQANVFGLSQDADAEFYDGSEDAPGVLASATFKNEGTLAVSGLATAGGYDADHATYAAAVASAYGVQQYVEWAETGNTKFTNSGVVSAYGEANANGDIAVAFANSVGYSAEMDDITGSAVATFKNKSEGEIMASAVANAVGHEGALAAASSIGVSLINDGEPEDGDSPDFVLDAKNAGLIYSEAMATASSNDPAAETALAAAIGVELAYFDGNLAGTFKNSGSIYAGAYADGATGFAWAVGILDPSTSNSANIINTGDITAYAEGPSAMATAIAVFGTTTSSSSAITAVAPTTGPAVVTNDGGTIWAGYSTDGGKTVLRGNAINTEGATVQSAFGTTTFAAAPNGVLIELMSGDDPASIFGNIDITGDDMIQVTEGWTRLDGIINPDMTLEGSLEIFSQGKLTLANTNELEGPSAAYVDSFTMGGSGSIGMEFNADHGMGDYPTITANSATLKGKFVATYAPDLYDDSFRYENVITAGTRSGKFDKVIDNSALLKSTLVYKSDSNVDLKVKRKGFGDVKGLTKNQSAAGDGIEKVYGKVSGKNDFSELTQTLFTLNDDDYADALNQLAGAEFAQLAQSVLWSTGQLNATVTDRMDCGLNWDAGAGSSDARGAMQCFDPGAVQVWGRIGGGWNNNDGDKNAPGYSEDQATFIVGGDYAINEQVFFGLAGGYFTSNMNFDGWGGRSGASIDYDGFQIAAYGGWDNGTWYARNILSYGGYNGSSHRDVGIGSSPVDPSAKFDPSVVSYYGEAGKRFAMQSGLVATPFVGLGIAGAEIGTFTEKDPHGTGAGLKVRGTDANSVASTLGVRVNGKWGAFTPEMSLAWRHEFADTTQTVQSSFAGAPKGANFNVISSDPGADALLLGIGGTYSVNGSNDLTIGYDGTFLNGYSSHEVVARWTYKF